jgi:hypothetical protein
VRREDADYERPEASGTSRELATNDEGRPELKAPRRQAGV